MEIITAKNYEVLSKMLATDFLSSLSKKNTNIGLPGGSTPIKMYELVSPIIKNNPLYSTVNYFNLDEVMSLDGKIRTNLELLENYFYEKNNIAKNQINTLELSNIDEFEELIKVKGGLDTIYLGVGIDGHIAGVTPYTKFDTVTHKGVMTEHFKDLVESSFNNRKDIPDVLATVGLKTIMSSKRIVVMLFGEKKAEIVKKAFFGRITEEIPASILQLHPNVTIYLDEDASSLVREEL